MAAPPECRRLSRGEQMKSDLLEALLNPQRSTLLAETSSVILLNGLDKRRREYKRVGWVYAVRNPSFVDLVFKIGQTTVSPSERIGNWACPSPGRVCSGEPISSTCPIT